MKYVLFDNDGILVNSEETAVLHDPAFLSQFGLCFTVPEYAALISGKTRAALVAALNEASQKQCGRDLPTNINDLLTANYVHQGLHHLKQVENVAEIITLLDKAGIPKAVASNGEYESMCRKLKNVGLHDLFAPHLYNKDHVGGKSKPDPDVFLHAMQQLGGQNPADCIVLDDSPTGIQAGRAAGMYVIGYSGGQHRLPGYDSTLLAHGADIVVDTMDKAKQIIASLITPPRPKALPGHTP